MSQKYIVAVSGGVDSVVLLDMLVKQAPPVVVDTSAQRERLEPQLQPGEGQVSEFTSDTKRRGLASPETKIAAGTSALHELQGEERFLELTSRNPAEGLAPPEIIIAHFDHGIRHDSAADASFVAELARSYGLTYETERQELGSEASEDLARSQRYQFLRRLAEQHQARIVTAHHADDALETIAINLVRGTGWRGLAALSAADIDRPLLGMSKSQMYDYALENRLEWVEDSTNQQDKYLRNRLRRQLASRLSSEVAAELLDLFKRQRQLRGLIEAELASFVSTDPGHDRYGLIQVESSLAMEILGAIIQAETGFRPTRPQLDRALLAIKTAKSGDQHQISRGARLDFTKREFFVQTD